MQCKSMHSAVKIQLILRRLLLIIFTVHQLELDHQLAVQMQVVVVVYLVVLFQFLASWNNIVLNRMQQHNPTYPPMPIE